VGGCWVGGDEVGSALAFETVSTVAGTARLSAAIPIRERALRREIAPDVIFSVIRTP
jgi:hypothetical protein